MSAAAARPMGRLSLVNERPPGPGLSDFILWLRANGCGERTIVDRTKHIEDFARHNPSFPFVSPMHVSAWLGREGYGQWSRCTYYGHLRSYFRFALENDVIDVDPMARMKRPKKGQGIPRPLTAAQVDLLLSTAKPAMRTRLILGLYAGLRAHEIAKIKGEDVQQDSIYVLGKGGVAAQIPTHPLIWAEAQCRPRVGYWFPSSTARGHVSMLSVSTGAGKHFVANGVEGSIHRCRHTYATELLRAGVNVRVVQTLMRHRSLASTMAYTAVDEDERLEGILRLAANVVPAGPRQEAQKRSHCDMGHEFTEANTYTKPNGSRQCKKCRQDRQARYNARTTAKRAAVASAS